MDDNLLWSVASSIIVVLSLQSVQFKSWASKIDLSSLLKLRALILYNTRPDVVISKTVQFLDWESPRVGDRLSRKLDLPSLLCISMKFYTLMEIEFFRGSPDLLQAIQIVLGLDQTQAVTKYLEKFYKLESGSISLHRRKCVNWGIPFLDWVKKNNLEAPRLWDVFEF